MISVVVLPMSTSTPRSARLAEKAALAEATGVVPGPCRGHKALAAGIDQDAMATEVPDQVAHQCPHAFLGRPALPSR